MPNEHNAPANPVAQTSLSPDRRAMLAGIGGLAAGALFLSARSAQAGPLEPPDGPVASTGKTTQEIFDKVAAVESRTAINSANTPGTATSLFKITQPGSYYLTGNITGEAGKHGIEIASHGVTLDLNGFELLGVSGSLDGINASVQLLNNMAVLNGSVRFWGGDGVDLAINSATNCRLEGLLAANNGGIGISSGLNSLMTRCIGFANGDHGISAGDGSTILNCSAISNQNSGIAVSRDSMVLDCVSRRNTVNGIRCVYQNVIRGNSCCRNGLQGNGAGIRALNTANRIEGNTCIEQTRGIEVNSNGSIIIRNICRGNDTNWVIAAGNAYGPIVATPAGAAVNGNTAAAALGSTDPNANFSY